MTTIVRTVTTDRPLAEVAAYLSDFSTTAVWDPHTAACTRVNNPDGGPVGLGSEFDNTQRLGPFRTTFRYRVTAFEPERSITLECDGRSVHLTDHMEFEAADGGGTVVVYQARFEPKGLFRLSTPLLALLGRRLGDEGRAGLERTLASLPAVPR